MLSQGPQDSYYIDLLVEFFASQLEKFLFLGKLNAPDAIDETSEAEIVEQLAASACLLQIELLTLGILLTAQV